MEVVKSIGIGCLSYLRPEHLKLFKKQIEKHTPPGAELYISYDDFEKKGVAYRSNEILKALRHHEYVFIFNDDCVVIQDGWAEYFISEHKRTGQHHFIYMVEGPTTKKIGQENGIDIYNNCSGVFMFLTKEVIQKVGGFCKDYGRYSYEHAGYTKRIHAAGLTPYGEYLVPKDAAKYMYAMDMQNNLSYNRDVNHNPSMVSEMAYIDGYIKQNRLIFEKDIQTVYQEL